MSLPPPYQTYVLEDRNDQPYMSPPTSPKSISSANSSPCGSPLRGFDSPPMYSKRLRDLNHCKPLQLSLNNPPTIHIQMPREDDFFDVEKQNTSQIRTINELTASALCEKLTPSTINLLTATRLEEGIDFIEYVDEKTPLFRADESRRGSGRHRRHNATIVRWQRSFSYDDREVGWMTFIGIAMFVFLLLTAGGVFVAWTAGGSFGGRSSADGGVHKAYAADSVKADAGIGFAATDGVLSRVHRSAVRRP